MQLSRLVAGITAALIAGTASAADVSFSLVADVQQAVPPGSTLPYEIHVAITNNGVPAQSQGVCLFSVNLTSDLRIDQSPVESFAPRIETSFNTVAPQSGVSDGAGGVAGIMAGQSCVADGESVLGIGVGGSSMIAAGTLRMPATPGQYTVRIAPVQVLLIAANGNPSLAPDSTSGDSLTVTVSANAPSDEDEPGDGAASTNGLSSDADLGTDGTGSGDDLGTDGLDGNGTDLGTSGGTGDGDEASTDGLDDGATGGQADGQPGTADPASAPVEQPLLGLCGAGATGPAALTLTGIIALRTRRRR